MENGARAERRTLPTQNAERVGWTCEPVLASNNDCLPRTHLHRAGLAKDLKREQAIAVLQLKYDLQIQRGDLKEAALQGGQGILEIKSLPPVPGPLATPAEVLVIDSILHHYTHRGR